MNEKPRFSQPVKKQTLAEQVAEAVQESILAGEWEGGEALPTEPELATQFGVSRAVIRDATRMLAAQGLVQAQHGKGVFVTDSQVDAFGDALLLALRRAEATVWDVEQFEQLVYPEVCALAAREASDEELESIRQQIESYLTFYEQIVRQSERGDGNLPTREQEQLREAFRHYVQAIFAATHNQLLTLLAQPLTRLRSLRRWQDDEGVTREDVIDGEKAYLRKVINTIATRDPAHVRSVISGMMKLPPQAEAAMRQTAVGETPLIPSPYPNLDD
jgi:GntR family transcriptional repressor for pyruvate dehydrogenase complex